MFPQIVALTAVISPDDVSTLTTAITENIKAAVPAGLAVMALLLGVSVIPRVIRKFF